MLDADMPQYTPDAYYAQLEGLEINGKSVYNPTPGTGYTAFTEVAPNNYPFYDDDEKYACVMQADGAQLSEWKPRYAPGPEQEEIDRYHAYETGVPHGYIAKGDAYKGLPTISLLVKSELHGDSEYGEQKDSQTNKHSGGAFQIHVTPKMRVEDVMQEIYVKGGIIPGLQRLMYAGKRLTDTQRTLEQLNTWQLIGRHSRILEGNTRNYQMRIDV